MKKEYLNAVNTILFSEKEEIQKVNNAIKSMYEIYSKETGIYAENQGVQHLTESISGGVVSPVIAASCLTQHKRTTQFLRGIHKAILDFPKDGQLRILYAGCGPYASLLTPLTAIFSKEKLSFTFLEISETSLQAVQKLYQNWGIDDYVQDFIQADATDPEILLNGPFDIIISETMQKALKNECQVPLTRNMVRFLKPNGTFIPQVIEIDAYLSEQMNEDEFNQSERLYVGNVYHLDFRSIPEEHSSVQLAIPNSDFQYLKLHTEIQVYHDIGLSLFDSTLNTPVILDRLSRPYPKLARFEYLETNRPDFSISYPTE